jgi:AmmeMemoRadiSam system protein B/AmmeMemoRadiSam system protein A
MTINASKTTLITISLTALTISLSAAQEGIMENPDTNYVRPPAVAGSFYPGSPTELAKMIAQYFHAAPKPMLAGRPLAIVSPHAGYIYSGGIAARGYKILEGEEYNTVIVISPSHAAYFKGVSAFDGKAYSTPLGEIPIDRELTKKIVAQSDLIKLSNEGHFKGGQRSEHALEVQLPFLQTTLGKFKLVALVMGDQDPSTCTALGQAIAKALGKQEALIVASSDLSHFHDSRTASKLDSVVLKDIERFDYHKLADDLDSHKTEACGGGPIIAAMVASRALGADAVEITGHGDSGDITGDKSNVVGYLSAVIYKSDKKDVYEILEDSAARPRSSTTLPEAETSRATVHDHQATGAEFGLSAQDKTFLLNIARQAIATELSGKELLFPQRMSEALQLQLNAFVTLNKHDELRGCIGTFRAPGPLYETIAQMARQAAFSDPRFMPVTKEELPDLDIEISVLTPMKRIYNPDSVVVGRDGLYMRRGNYAGVLLPQVPVEQGWGRIEFLDHTCLKAGLPTSAWKDKQTELYVFQAEIFGER